MTYFQPDADVLRATRGDGNELGLSESEKEAIYPWIAAVLAPRPNPPVKEKP